MEAGGILQGLETCKDSGFPGLLCRLSETMMLPIRILEGAKLTPSITPKQPYPQPQAFRAPCSPSVLSQAPKVGVCEEGLENLLTCLLSRASGRGKAPVPRAGQRRWSPLCRKEGAHCLKEM